MCEYYAISSESFYVPESYAISSEATVAGLLFHYARVCKWNISTSSAPCPHT